MALGLAIVGLGGATAGGVLVIAAESRYATVRQLAAQTDRSCPAGDPRPSGLCAELRTAAADTDRMGNFGIGALVVGGLLGVGAGVVVLLPATESNARRPAASLVPFVSGDAGGAVISGSF